MTAPICTWCSRTEAQHRADKVTGHDFAVRCPSKHFTGRGPAKTVTCMDALNHDGLHANGTWRWDDDGVRR